VELIKNYKIPKQQAKFMKILISISLISFLFLLSNCTPARIISDDFSKDSKTSKVVIHRESKFLFLLVPAIFGYDEKDKVQLWSGNKSEIKVPIGKHEFFVRSNQISKPSKLNVEIKEGKSICFVINPEPKPILKFILLPLNWFSHAFRIEEKEGLCQ